jgi:hypothetical protein
MQQYVETCAAGAAARRLSPLLDRLVARPPLHARFVNTLARLEYVGVRKMLKSRRAERLDLNGLQHVLDEAVHALRLKKAAVALGASCAAEVPTFADADTLAGDAGEAYFQALDRCAEAVVTDEPEAGRAEANYLVTSAAVEVRAQVFYPLYEARLRAHGAPFSVGAITRDEDRHLAEMTEGLGRLLGADWRRCLGPVLEAEERLFATFLDALETAMVSHAAAA